MTENFAAIYKIRKLWFPAGCQPLSQKFISTRLLIPDGDRRQSAYSSNAKNKCFWSFSKRDDDVMTEFILSDNVHFVKKKVSLLQKPQGPVEIFEVCDFVDKILVD